MALRHYLQFSDFNREEYEYLFARTRWIKERFKSYQQYWPLVDRTLVMIFEKASTRTRLSFEAGMQQLGGAAIYLNTRDSQLGRGEPVEDAAQVISRMSDIVMIRTFEQSIVERFSTYSRVPVINGLTDKSHPCQVMADVMTYEEHRGPIAGKKVVWAGDGNNVAASFLHAAGQFGFDFTFTGPETLDPEPKFVDFARSKGSTVLIERDPVVAVQGADLVVTDTWVSMHDPESAKERRHNQLRGYQVNEKLMAQAKPDSLFMHCLPAHRNDEATSAVMDGPHSVIFDEAENRLHAQKAVMRWCLGL